MQRTLFLALPRAGTASRQMTVLGRPSRLPTRSSMPSRAFSLWPSKPPPAPTSSAAPVPETEFITEPVAIDPTVPPSELLVEPIEGVVATQPGALDAVVNAIPSESVIPALQFGDLAAQGLCNFTPVGLYQLLIETINVTTGLPWFWTIAATGAIVRLALSPFLVMNAQQIATTHRLNPILKPLLEEQNQAAAANDRVRLSEVRKELNAIRAANGVTGMKMVGAPILQVTATISAFWGLENMVKLPVVQLTQSGFDLLPDLTVLPPTWFAAAFAGSVFIQTALAGREVLPDAPGAAMIKNMKYIAPVLAYQSAYWFNLPTALIVSMMSFSMVHSTQSVIMHLPAVRKSLGLMPLGKPIDATTVVPPPKRKV